MSTCFDTLFLGRLASDSVSASACLCVAASARCASRPPSRVNAVAPCRNRLRVTMFVGSFGDGSMRRLPQQLGVMVGQSGDQFAEQAVGPGEPGPREFRGIVLIEGFVHEAGAGVGGLEPVQALADLAGVVAG